MAGANEEAAHTPARAAASNAAVSKTALTAANDRMAATLNPLPASRAAGATAAQ
jgi:hypothetical protein